MPGIDAVCYEEAGRCFWMVEGLGNMDYGRATCQRNGGDLAVIPTTELWEFVTDNFGNK